MSRSFILFVTLFFLGLAIRAVYEQLKKARRIDEGDRPVFFAVFAGMAVLWTSWFAMCPQDPVHVPIPAAGRWAGLALLVVGWVLALGALAELRGVENIDHLVTTRAAVCHEGRARGSDPADGGQRLPPREGAHLPSVPVLPRVPGEASR